MDRDDHFISGVYDNIYTIWTIDFYLLFFILIFNENVTVLCLFGLPLSLSFVTLFSRLLSCFQVPLVYFPRDYFFFFMTRLLYVRSIVF